MMVQQKYNVYNNIDFFLFSRASFKFFQHINTSNMITHKLSFFFNKLCCIFYFGDNDFSYLIDETMISVI